MHGVHDGPRASEGTQSSTAWGAEGILYRVIKLKNPIVSKGSYREPRNILSQKNFQF